MDAGPFVIIENLSEYESDSEIIDIPEKKIKLEADKSVALFLTPSIYEFGDYFNQLNNLVKESEEISNFQDSSIVYFDIVTNDIFDYYLGGTEVVQIAARFEKEKFNVYILPPRGMSEHIKRITGLSTKYNETYYNGQKMETLLKKDAYIKLIEFLKNIGNNVILITHDGLTFDFRVLVRDLRTCNLLENFLSVAHGFLDTHPMMHKKLIDRKNGKLKFTLVDLANDLLDENAIKNAPHNALYDTEILEKIVEKVGFTKEDLQLEAYSIKKTIKQWDTDRIEKYNIFTLHCLKDVVPSEIISKIAQEGIDVKHLVTSFKKGEEGGIARLLTANVNGRPRVTRNQKIIDDIVHKIKIYSAQFDDRIKLKQTSGTTRMDRLINESTPSRFYSRDGALSDPNRMFLSFL